MISETLIKLDKFSRIVRANARNVLCGRSLRRASSGLRTKSFVKIKHVLNTHKFDNYFSSRLCIVTHHIIGTMGSRPTIVGNLFRCYVIVPKL